MDDELKNWLSCFDIVCKDATFMFKKNGDKKESKQEYFNRMDLSNNFRFLKLIFQIMIYQAKSIKTNFFPYDFCYWLIPEYFGGTPDWDTDHPHKYKLVSTEMPGICELHVTPNAVYSSRDTVFSTFDKRTYYEKFPITTVAQAKTLLRYLVKREGDGLWRIHELIPPEIDERYKEWLYQEEEEEKLQKSKPSKKRTKYAH